MTCSSFIPFIYLFISIYKRLLLRTKTYTDKSNKIINIIISVTDKRHRVYDDIVNNPDLAISIIDRAFAIARVEDSEVIKIEHFIESFEFCERIYEQTKQGAISELKNIDGEKLNKKCLSRTGPKKLDQKSSFLCPVFFLNVIWFVNFEEKYTKYL